jgi:hypothetical protein
VLNYNRLYYFHLAASERSLTAAAEAHVRRARESLTTSVNLLAANLRGLVISRGTKGLNQIPTEKETTDRPR